MAKRVTARKYGGDDAGSWAVFIDGRPWLTGLTKGEVPYWKKEAERLWLQGRASEKQQT